MLSNAENTTVPGELKKLAAGACAAENKALPLQIHTVPQTSLDQKLQLLAGQNALPAMFAAGNAPATTKTLVKAGDIADLQTELTKLGVANDVEPAALSTIKNLYGGFQRSCRRIQHRGDLLQQEDLHAAGHHGSADVGPPRFRCGQVAQQGHPALLGLRSAGLADHPADQRLPLPDASARTR